MNEIIFSHFQKIFKVDEPAYAEIMKQVNEKSFKKQLAKLFKTVCHSNKLANNNAVLRAKIEVEKELDRLKVPLEKSQMIQTLALVIILAASMRKRDKILSLKVGEI
jgi:hypothetical protein